MSNEPNTEPEVEPDETPVTPEEEAPEEEAPPKGSNAEAAKYRRKLRDTEGEVQRLTEQLDTLRRDEAERIASAHLKVPAGMWAAKVALADLLDEAGKPDPAKVIAAAKKAATDLGLATRTPAGFVPSQGTGDPRPAAPSGLDAMAEKLDPRK